MTDPGSAFLLAPDLGGEGPSLPFAVEQPPPEPPTNPAGGAAQVAAVLADSRGSTTEDGAPYTEPGG